MSERGSLAAPLGEWLSSKELAALAGIDQRRASKACKCCHEGGKWRGNALSVRKKDGNRSLNGMLWSGKTDELDGLANRTVHPGHFVTTAADVTAWMGWAGYDDAALVRAAIKIAARPGPDGGLHTLQMLFDMFESAHPDKKLTAKAFLDHGNLYGKFSPTKQKGGNQ